MQRPVLAMSNQCGERAPTPARSGDASALAAAVIHSGWRKAVALPLYFLAALIAIEFVGVESFIVIN